MILEAMRIWRGALLAEAAYVRAVLPNSSGSILADRLSRILSLPLANMIVSSSAGGLNAKHQILSTAFDSGFSSTIFTFNGETYLAIRGTQPLDPGDLVADGQIGAFGLASDQAIALYRYWKKATTPAGAPVQYSAHEIEYLASLSQRTLSPLLNISSYLQLTSALASDRGLGVLNSSDRVVVVGHSLGGHLVQVFVRNFPLAVERAYTFNGAAVGGAAAEIVDRLFGFTGASLDVPGNAILNVAAKHGFDFTAGAGIVLGSTLRVFNENSADLFSNHFISKLTDSLALYELFGLVDPALSFDAVTDILDSTSNVPSASLETGLDQLRTLFAPAGTQPAATSIGERDTYFANLLALRDALLARTQAVSLAAFPGMSSAEIARRAMAADGLAYRYALEQLLPFAVTGTDYSSFNESGRLDLLAEDESTGTLSAGWIRDRAELLAWLLARNAKDAATVIQRTDGGESLDFRWQPPSGSMTTLRVLANLSTLPAQTAQVFFGTALADQVAGFGMDDRLYGGRGDDTLEGQGGDDRLEGDEGADQLLGGEGNDVLAGGRDDDTLDGGSGKDRLQGGPGFDTYLVPASTVGDVITDSDGAGRVVLDGVELGGGAGSDGLFWNSDRTIKYAFTGDLAQAGTLTIQGALVVENFRNGDLGITLQETSSDSPSPPEAGGARLYVDRPYTADEIALSSGNADYVFQHQWGSPFDDTFLAGEEMGPYFTGRGGNDRLVGGYGYARFWGGAGHDQLDNPGAGPGYQSANGVHVLAGGAGRDTLAGSSQNDILYGDFHTVSKTSTSSATHLTIDNGTWRISGSPPSATELGGVPADFFSEDPVLDWWGNAEPTLAAYVDLIVGTPAPEELPTYFDDYLEGNAGNDGLVGGAGSDILLGGSGNDRLYGDYPLGPEPSLLMWDRISFSGLETLAIRFGSAGNDVIDGGDGNDFITDRGGEYTLATGGSGDDQIEVPGISFNTRQEYVRADGGSGNDKIIVTANTASITGGDGSDIVNFWQGVAVVEGEAGNDRLWMQSEWVEMRAGEGDDSLAARGYSVLDAGPGNDLYITYAGSEGSHSIFSDDPTGSDSDRLIVPYAQDNYDLFRDGDNLVIATNETLTETAFGITTTGINPALLTRAELLALFGSLSDSASFFFSPFDPTPQGPALTIVVNDWFLGDRYRLDSVKFGASGVSRTAQELEAAMGLDATGYAGIAMAGDSTEDPGDSLIDAADLAGPDEPSPEPEAVDEEQNQAAAQNQNETQNPSSAEDQSDTGTPGDQPVQASENTAEPATDSATQASASAATQAPDTVAASASDSPVTAPVLPVVTELSTNAPEAVEAALPVQVVQPESMPAIAASSASTPTSTQSVTAIAANEAAESSVLVPTQALRKARNEAERTLLGDDTAAAQPVAVSNPIIEAMFTRLEPPPMSTQQWLEEWFPVGARPGPSEVRPATERSGSPLPPAPTELPELQAPELPPAEGESLTPEEIMSRYEEIDAWLAAHDGSEDGIAGGAGSLSSFVAFGNAGMLFETGAETSSAWPLRNIAALTSLGGHSMQVFKGLDEGFARL